jgi:hypothetical protein
MWRSSSMITLFVTMLGLLCGVGLYAWARSAATQEKVTRMTVQEEKAYELKRW